MAPPSAEAEKSDIDGLLQLARAHQRQHEDRAYDAAAPAAVQRCKTMLRKLSKLLPRLVAPIKGMAPPAAAAVLQSLCELLRLLLGGRVCPEWRQLFVDARAADGATSCASLLNMLLFMLNFYANPALGSAQGHVLGVVLQMARLLQETDAHAFGHLFQDTVQLLEDAFLLEEHLKNRDGLDLRDNATIACFLDTSVHIYQNADGALRPKTPLVLCGCAAIDDYSNRYERVEQLKLLLPRVRVDSATTAIILRRSISDLARPMVLLHRDTVENDRAFHRLCRLTELFIRKDEELLCSFSQDETIDQSQIRLSRSQLVAIARSSRALLEVMLHTAKGSDAQLISLSRLFFERVSITKRWPELEDINTTVLKRIHDCYKNCGDTVSEVLWPKIEKFISENVSSYGEGGIAKQRISWARWKPVIGLLATQLQCVRPSPPLALFAAVVPNADFASFDAITVADSVKCVLQFLTPKQVLQRVVQSMSRALMGQGVVSLAVVRSSYSSRRKRKRVASITGTARNRAEDIEFIRATEDQYNATAPEHTIGKWLANLLSFPGDNDEENIALVSIAIQVLIPLKDRISCVSRMESSTIFRTLFQRIEDTAKTLGPPVREVSEAYLDFWIILLRLLEDRELAKYQALSEKVFESIEQQSFYTLPLPFGDTDFDLPSEPQEHISIADILRFCSGGCNAGLLNSQPVDTMRIADDALELILSKSAAVRSMFLVNYVWARAICIGVSSGASWRMAFPWRVTCRVLQQDTMPDEATCALVHIIPVLVYCVTSEGIASPKEVVACVLEVLSVKLKRNISPKVRQAIVSASGNIPCAAAAGQQANDTVKPRMSSKRARLTGCCHRLEGGQKISVSLSLFESILSANCTTDTVITLDKIHAEMVSTIGKIFSHCDIDEINQPVAAKMIALILSGLESSHAHVRNKTAQILEDNSVVCSMLLTDTWCGPSRIHDLVEECITKAQIDSDEERLLLMIQTLGTFGCQSDLYNVESPDVYFWVLLRLTTMWIKFAKLQVIQYAGSAYDQIQRVMLHHKTSWRRLCVDFPDLCYPRLINELLALGMVKPFLDTFMRTSVKVFLHAGARYVLPNYVVEQNVRMLQMFTEEYNVRSDEDVKMEVNFASTSETQEASISDLLRTHLAFVLKELIIHQSTDKSSAEDEWEFLLNILSADSSMRDVISHASVQLQSALVWELGGSRYRSAKRALREVTHYLHQSSDNAQDESNGRMIPRENFLGLMSELANRVSGKGYATSSTQTRIRALKCIDRLLKMHASSSDDLEQSAGVLDPFVPKIMATLKIGLLDPELIEHAMHAWNTFLRMLSPKALEANLCSIVVSLLPCFGFDVSSMLLEAKPGETATACWSLELLSKMKGTLSVKQLAQPTSHTAMNTAVSLLKYLFVEKRQVLKVAFPKISLLPSIPELDEVYTVIVAEVGDPAERPLQTYLVDIGSYVNHWDMAVREVALAQLFRCLVIRGPELQDLMQKEADLFIDSAIGDVAMSVVKVATIDGTEHTKLLCARCLGALGAIDAARMPINASIPSGRTSLNSKNVSPRRVEHSTKDLACVLIESWLVTELRAAPENTDSVAFAIQELLKFLAQLTVDPQHSGQSLTAVDSTAPLTAAPSGSIDNRHADSEKSIMPDWMRRRFERKDVLQLVDPYWATKYGVADEDGRGSAREVNDRRALDDITFYEKYGSSYEDWLLNWSRRLIRISQPPERKIFIACRSVLLTCPQITRFLLPYLIQNVLRSGQPEIYREVKREIMMVLSDRDDSVAIDGVIFEQDEEMSESIDGSSSFLSSAPDTSTRVERSAVGEQSNRHHQCCQTIFTMLDELNDWVWTSEKKRIPASNSSSASNRSTRAIEVIPSDFDDQEKENLEEFLKDIPSQALSNAAYRIKAYARATQYFEVYLRQQHVPHSGTFVGSIGPVSLELISTSALYLQQLYKSVDEPDALIGFATLRRLHEDSHHNTGRSSDDPLNLTDLMHQIIDYEQLAQWEDALACYEQAIQVIQSAYPIEGNASNGYNHDLRQFPVSYDGFSDGRFPRHPVMLKPQLYAGMIGCLIQLGRLESALQHIYGIVIQEPQFKGTLYPCALECSWRLSRWDLLSELLSAERQNPLLTSRSNGNGYDDLRVRRVDVSELLIVRVLHSLHKCDTDAFVRSVNEARLEIMGPLAAASTESYQRAYPLLHKLHFLHEAEQGFIFLHSRTSSRRNQSNQGWDESMGDEEDQDMDADEHARSLLWKTHVGIAWDSRYELLAPSLKYRDPILALRRVLLNEARLPNDVALNWLEYAKLARKEGYHRTANSAVMHAEALDNPYAMLERAKLLVVQDRMHEALQVLEPSKINPAKLDYNVEDPRLCAKNLLLATNWMQESGQRQGQQVIERYEAVIRFDPAWEKGYFYLGRYYEYLLSVKRSELSERGNTPLTAGADTMPTGAVVDADIHLFLVRLMENYVHALRHGTKFVFQSLPRLLTLWFEYGELLHARSVSSTSVDEANAALEKQVLNDMATVVKDAAKVLPAYEWLMCFPQVASRVCHPNPVVVKSVTLILTRVLIAYPTQAMWVVLGLSRSLNNQRKFQAQSVLSDGVRHFASSGRQDLATSLDEGGVLVDELIRLAGHDPQSQRKIHIRLTRLRSKILVPTQAALTTVLPQSGKAPSDMDHSAFAPTSQVHIRAFSDNADVIMSKEKPKRIEVVGTDGKWYPFLCKREKTGDLRKDARMMEFNALINKLLQKDREGRKRKLRLRTYAVVCLNEESGLMEWVEHTRPMRQLVGQIRKTERGYLPSLRLSHDTKERYLAMQRKYAADPQAMANYYRRKFLTLPEFTPRFHQWFYNNFPDPTAWFEARRAFTRSAALWSMVGHIVGLGDRHGENLLIETTTGECVHVDFDCLFDKGLKLAKPEIVPFRLTPNLIDAFGITGVEGVFRKVAEVAMQLLRSNQPTLRSVLESFIHDPLVEWSRRGKATQREGSSKSDRSSAGGGAGAPKGEQGNAEAHVILAAIDDRLRGVYNLGAAIRPQLSAAHLRLLPAQESLPLSVQGQVDKLIQEATAHENLAQMYIGWMPFL